MTLRPCLDCGKPSPQPRCSEHRAAWERHRGTPHQRGYGRAWQRLRNDIVNAWLAEHGPVCPGWRRPAHQVDPRHLTGDHTHPVALAGTQVPERSDVAVLCRSCNSAKQATVER